MYRGPLLPQEKIGRGDVVSSPDIFLREEGRSVHRRTFCDATTNGFPAKLRSRGGTSGGVAKCPLFSYAIETKDFPHPTPHVESYLTQVKIQGPFRSGLFETLTLFRTNILLINVLRTRQQRFLGTLSVKNNE